MKGRPRNLQSVEQLLQLFEDYKKEIKSNPRIKIEYVGREGERVETPLVVPLTMEGFECFCYEIVGCVEQYFKNQDGAYEDFLPICSRIKKEIRRDQIEGGMVGQYNTSITQRLNGLKESQDVTSNNQSISAINVSIVKPNED